MHNNKFGKERGSRKRKENNSCLRINWQACSFDVVSHSERALAHRQGRQGGALLSPTPGENVIMIVMVVIPGAIISFNTEATARCMSVPCWDVCSCSRVILFNLPSSLMWWILLLSSFCNCGADLRER